MQHKGYWTSDPTTSRLQFKVKHFMIASVKGVFRDFSVIAATEGESFENASVEFIAQVSSIDTGVEARDNHLKSDDFFNAKQFPTIRFKSTRFISLSGMKFRLEGDLSIRGETRRVELDAEYRGKVVDAHGRERAGFALSFEIDRLLFGLHWNFMIEGSRAVVSNKVKVEADVVMVRQDEPPVPATQIDSLRAALLTQNSQLPDLGYFRRFVNDALLFFQPKDTVGGDFYWFEEVKERLVLIVGDSTGHGIEGSLKAMMTLTMINQIVAAGGETRPLEILLRLHEGLLASVRNSRVPNPSMLSFDGAALSYSPRSRTIEYSGAGVSLFRIREGELVEFKAKRLSVGSHVHDVRQLTSTTIDVAPGDQFYLLSDGFKDQFGGPWGKKFGPSQVRELLLASHHSGSFEEIAERIRAGFQDWKGNFEQMDDVTVFGFRV